MTTLDHDLGLIPPARLGPLAAQARRVWGLSLAAAAQATDGLVSPAELRLLESGRLAPTEPQIRALFSVLGIALEDIVPVRVRLEIDPTQGRLVAGGSVTQFLPDATDHQILRRYLCLIYALRRVRAGTFVVPRADDLEVLAATLNRSPGEVRLKLEHLMRHHRDDLRLGVRSLAGRAALPGLGLLVAMTTLGALLLVEAQPLNASPLAPQSTVPTPPVHAPRVSEFVPTTRAVDIGSPLVVERLPRTEGSIIRSGDPRVVLTLVRSGPHHEGDHPTPH